MIFHVNCIQENSNVVIGTADTDMLITALSCMSQTPTHFNIWFAVALWLENTIRYINVNRLNAKPLTMF